MTTAPHTLKDQLEAAIERAKELEIERHIAEVDKLLADRRAKTAEDPKEKPHD